MALSEDRGSVNLKGEQQKSTNLKNTEKTDWGEKKRKKVLGTCDAATKDFTVVLTNPRRRRESGRLKTSQIWQKTYSTDSRNSVNSQNKAKEIHVKICYN